MNERMCVYVRVCVRARARARVCVCVCVCARARALVCVNFILPYWYHRFVTFFAAVFERAFRF